MIPILVIRSGFVPDLGLENNLRYAPTPVASKLTGLSTDKLREWTSRRALVPADIRPKQQGSPAKFSWQTILVLRIAVTLRDRFHLELQAHRRLFTSLRKELRSKSFIARWGQSLVVSGGGNWTLVDNEDTFPCDDVLVVRLDPHLKALSAGFALPTPASAPNQFDLFSLPRVREGKRKESAAHRQRPSESTSRRRSA